MNENKQTPTFPYMSRIAGMVILYNSERNAFDNSKTYIDQIEKLYVVDNSDKPNPELIEQFKTLSIVQYVSNDGNQGVAYALNRAAELALADGFHYLLTMDDDTRLPSGAVTSMLQLLADYPAADKVGLISGVHSDNLLTDEPYRTVLYTMTSGNLLNLQAYQQVGPFRNNLFIDHVDHEYGLRLNKAGFTVLELPTLRINHRLGERKSVFFGNEFFISHAPVRSYYIVRNGWVVAVAFGRQFPAFRRHAVKLITKEWLKTILFEDQKIRRLRLLWRGTTDALRGRLGKLEEQP